MFQYSNTQFAYTFKFAYAQINQLWKQNFTQSTNNMLIQRMH